jgi:hypothetical protein
MRAARQPLAGTAALSTCSRKAEAKKLKIDDVSTG